MRKTDSLESTSFADTIDDCATISATDSDKDWHENDRRLPNSESSIVNMSTPPRPPPRFLPAPHMPARCHREQIAFSGYSGAGCITGRTLPMNDRTNSISMHSSRPQRFESEAGHCVPDIRASFTPTRSSLKSKSLIENSSPLRKKVSFDSLTIHYHAVSLGDSPSVRKGAPLALTWQRLGSQSFDNVDLFEAAKPPPRSARVLRLRASRRAHVLKSAGVSDMEIQSCIREVQALQAEMRATALDDEDEEDDDLMVHHISTSQQCSKEGETNTRGFWFDSLCVSTW